MIETRWTDFYGGSTRLELMIERRSVSHIEGIVPYTLRFGSALVPADGISGVGTEEDCRHRGYAAQVMTAALGHMAQGSAAISYLLGIRDFYHRFGYAPVGPSYELSVGTTINAAFPMRDGFHVRPATAGDLPAVQALYDMNSRNVLGAAVRPAAGLVWNTLLAAFPKEECRVVTDLGGMVVGCAWLAGDFWAVREFARDREDKALIIGEALAAGPRSATAVIAACRAWADEEATRRGAPIHQVRMPLPPVGPMAEALKLQHSLAQQKYVPNGGFMARVVDVQRLLTALAPELRRRAQAGGLAGTLTLRTEIGEGSLTLNQNARAPHEPGETIEMSQTTLIRLVFGTMSAEAILDHDDVQVTGFGRDLLSVLFPAGCPHLYLPDRC